MEFPANLNFKLQSVWPISPALDPVRIRHFDSITYLAPF